MSLKMNDAPYQRSPRTTFRIMMELTAALLIVWLAAVIYNFTLDAEFGVKAILLMVVALVATAAIDAGVALIKHKKGGNLKNEIIDSVVKNYSYVTAIIFTLCCPVYVSYYVIIIGCLAATGIKHCFGGFGKNIFNPAIIGRIVVGIAFPTAFNVTPDYQSAIKTGATLTTQYSGLGVKWLSDVLPGKFNLGNLLIGNYAGSLGETFTLLILVLGIVLMVRKVINWRSSVFYLGTVAITSLFIGFFIEDLNPFTYMMYHLCLGGLMFGAIFMITDPVTSPTSPFGKALIGVIAGLITVLIRVAGGYPEGVMYSIAFINVLSPAIDKLVVGRTTDGHFKKWGVIASFLVASVAINTALSVSAVKADEGGNSSPVVPELSREEKLFGIEGATYEEVTLGTKSENIVKTYVAKESNIPVALCYELSDETKWTDEHVGEMSFTSTVGVSFDLINDTIKGAGAFDAYVNYADNSAAVLNKFIGLNAFDVANMTIDSHDGIDFAASATMTSTNVFNLVVEASKQYTTVDKFYNAFGVEATFTKLETTGTNIQSAFTYTVEGVNYVAYFVYNENGVSIDDAHETIYPVVAVSINLTDDKIAAAKVITNATSHAWATAYYSSVDTFVGSLVGLDSNELATKTANNHKDYDTVASATYSSKGVFNYVLSACKQYVNTDKANLVGGNA